VPLRITCEATGGYQNLLVKIAMAEGIPTGTALAVNDIEDTKTKVRSPQTNGICARFHKTILQEFYQVAFRKKIYDNLDELQKDLDEWFHYYNNDRTRQGKMCCGRTPMQTLIDGKQIWKEKFIN
jgi:hypothetical protein